jgi:hypothetical protein
MAMRLGLRETGARWNEEEERVNCACLAVKCWVAWSCEGMFLFEYNFHHAVEGQNIYREKGKVYFT